MLRYLFLDDALREHLIAHLLLEIIERLAGLLLDEFMKLIRIRNLLVRLNLRHAPRDVGVYVDAEVFALLHQEEFIDLIAQPVCHAFVGGIFERSAEHALLPVLSFECQPLFIELAARNDLPVHFGDDLFDHDRHGPVGRQKRGGQNERSGDARRCGGKGFREMR